MGGADERVHLRQCDPRTLSLDYAEFSTDVDTELPGRGVTALFGHSGSGKTTLLRCVAGLERSGRGQLSVNGEHWQDCARKLFVPPHQRAIGYVFGTPTCSRTCRCDAISSSACAVWRALGAWPWSRRWNCWASLTCSNACRIGCPAASASVSASPARC